MSRNNEKTKADKVNINLVKGNDIKCPKSLTLTIINKGESLNYSEGYSNISQIKKITINGKQYPYASRSSILKSLKDIISENCKKKGKAFLSTMQIPETLAEKKDREKINDENEKDNEDDKSKKAKKVNQYSVIAGIKDYPELEFGYLKTQGIKNSSFGTPKRSSKIRMSNMVSLDEFSYDTDYLSNLNMTERTRSEIYERINKGEFAIETAPTVENNLSETEINRGLYTYTITIDLDQIGYEEREYSHKETECGSIEVNYDEINLDMNERCERVLDILEAIEFLNRDIRGRREDLSPLMIIGGVYNTKNPIFLNTVTADDKGNILIDPIIESIPREEIGKTRIGIKNGLCRNLTRDDFESAKTISKTFEDLRNDIISYYSDPNILRRDENEQQ